MDGHKQYLTDLIEGKLTRFVIPVYQRNYDWKPEQCGRLFDDLVEVAKTGRTEHFFGSIVSQTPRGERVVIDGQQRITTVFLLLAAIRTQVKAGIVTSNDEDLAEDIDDYYLIDKKHKQDQKLRLKLVKSDSEAFRAILDEKPDDYIQGSNVTQNFLYFLDRIARMDISVDELYESIKSLCIIDITLDPPDDAQLIFESLNSTGLDLSEADKIRNFVLMNLNQERQEIYYEDYWNAVEHNTDYRVSDYIRFFLAAREAKTPAIKKVYPAFRTYAHKYFKDPNGGALEIDTEPLLKELLAYSKHYRACIRHDTGVKDIDSALKAIHVFDASVTQPYLLNLLEYRAQGDIDDDAVATVLWTLDTYLFRRWASGLPANALNKVFETLHGDALRGVADGAEYSKVVKYVLTHKGGQSRLPDDGEFLYALDTRDFYRVQNRKYYLYDRLENGTSDERVEVVSGLEEGNFSVEHVMPQTLNAEWKRALGDDWERVHEEWCHKMANLTLTAYNSDYSNRPFQQKRDMKDGFRASGFRMNQWIAQQETWGEPQMKKREEMLEEQFLETWPYPETSYEPKKALPEVAELDSGVEFTGRRIAAFSFMGVRYVATQWNDMEAKVLQLLHELEPAKIHSLVDGTSYPASAFRSTEAQGHSKIARGVYARTASSTAAKIDLLKSVFEICEIDANELSFEMPLDADE
ncbi:uncharacterized conserved protein [Cryptobacterium curtum DSM 15641]|uniref:Uncharacterized conserved protein n=1 Tax=Cryptobacterium curtum (strain ATCC 700683 / DSM 15641 / CCUG 43107 / 12-3) TaxID=469378 RepID=C7MLC0_CRYCD|nr:DUF262 domain-containing protein [Cryptobacterium curtum]ACU95067.1 uncharacterized conserved protein [Cryptobacterium curtum DSM 15641]